MSHPLVLKLLLAYVRKREKSRLLNLPRKVTKFAICICNWEMWNVHVYLYIHALTKLKNKPKSKFSELVKNYYSCQRLIWNKISELLEAINKNKKNVLLILNMNNLENYYHFILRWRYCYGSITYETSNDSMVLRML